MHGGISMCYGGKFREDLFLHAKQSLLPVNKEEILLVICKYYW